MSSEFKYLPDIQWATLTHDQYLNLLDAVNTWMDTAKSATARAEAAEAKLAAVAALCDEVDYADHPNKFGVLFVMDIRAALAGTETP